MAVVDMCAELRANNHVYLGAKNTSLQYTCLYELFRKRAKRNTYVSLLSSVSCVWVFI